MRSLRDRQPATAPVWRKCLSVKFDVADVGSPQPPPGGGLLSRVPQVRSCRPTARLRAYLEWTRSVRTERAAAWNGGEGSQPLDAEAFLWQIRSRRDRRAAASRRRRPAARVPLVRFERALRRLRPELEYTSKQALQPFFILNSEFAPERALRRPRPECPPPIYNESRYRNK